MNDWQLPLEAFDWLSKFLNSNWIVVEFGSGDGSKRVLEMCAKLYSVEHDPKYVRRSTDRHKFVYAPIKRGWYSKDALWAYLPESYDFIIVDGPTKEIGRKGILLASELLDVPMLIDDTQRPEEKRIAYELAEYNTRKCLQFHSAAGGREFATIEVAE